MASKKSAVALGFVETTDKWRLLCHLFPSKVGGKPAWLSLRNIPTGDDVRCATCQNPCGFLLQVYSPVDDKDTCFHRTLFLFVCKNASCYKPNDSSNIIVFRCQLAKANEFYSADPPDYDHFHEYVDYPKVDKLESLCVVCGCRGSKRCSKCHSATYCSREHQTLDWKAGHKQTCSSEEKDVKENYSKFLFPEFELVTEPENNQISQEKTDDQKLQEYEKFMQSTGEQLSRKVNEKDLESMAQKESQQDKPFHKFQKRIAHEPEQVLRYETSGEPLWVSGEGLPKPEDIQDCQCGAPRQFEFQVLPQLLNHLNVDSLEASVDWGTLAIYTCSKNCDQGSPYHREVVWKQDFSNVDAPGLEPSI